MMPRSPHPSGSSAKIFYMYECVQKYDQPICTYLGGFLSTIEILVFFIYIYYAPLIKDEVYQNPSQVLLMFNR